jgi:hypothetical protein
MRTRFRRKKKKAVKAEVVELEELTPDEELERLHLERKVERAFYEAGMALAIIRERRLYRSTHPNFELYVQERFGFNRISAHNKIVAAEVFENLFTNGEQVLPSNERQVRPIVSLAPREQLQVWQQAVSEAGGKVPSGRIVSDIVQRIREKNPVPIPFRVGEVCQIIVKDNPELRGKGGCWCIVRAVDDFSCTVDTFDSQYQLRPEHLNSLEFTKSECKQMEDIGVRMSELYVHDLDEAAKWILNGLARINRAYLTTLEEKLLRVLELEYRRQN